MTSTVEITKAADVGVAVGTPVGASPLEMLRDMSEITVKQTRKGCLQELMGCEAKNEFKLFNSLAEAKEGDAKMIGYSLEDSSCINRFCCANARAFEQTVWTSVDQQTPVLKIDRPFTCGQGQLILCIPPCKGTPCYPTITYADPATGPIGGAEIPCWCCVPAIMVTDAAGLYVPS